MPFEPRGRGVRWFLRLPNGRIEREVDDEIAFHIESRVSDLVRAGTTEENARRIAEIEFGDREASRRELAAVDRNRRRRQHVAEVFGTLGQDLRYAIRGLRRSPAFALTSIPWYPSLPTAFVWIPISLRLSGSPPPFCWPIVRWGEPLKPS